MRGDGGRSTSIRAFLAILLACSSAWAASPRPPVKARQVIFNCDGCSVRQDNNKEHDVNRWIENLFTGLDANHVDALFWCDGSGGNTALYDSRVLELDGARIGKPDPWVSKWIEEGNDPPKVVVREARRRGLDVFYSFRINDIHDAFMPNELPTFKVRHPEWQIGKGKPYGYPTALNFAVPEVRNLKHRVIEEIFARYDFDGIEIDFLRGPPFFLPGQEAANAHVLTEFLRSVREMLDEKARRRGRRIEVAARVDETIEGCHLDGFEVEAWAKRGLIDLLIMGSGTIEVDVPAFKRAVAGTPVRIYPCIYGWPSKYMPIPETLARGIAATFWRDRPDGVYVFNWFPHQPDKRYQIELLREIGRPDVLARRDLMYVAERGTPQREYPHNWLRAKLPTTLQPGQLTEIPIDIGCRPPDGAVVEVRVVTDGKTSLAVRLDGQPIAAPQKPAKGCVAVRVRPGLLGAGRHRIGLCVSTGRPNVSSVEVHVCQPALRRAIPSFRKRLCRKPL